MRKMLFKITGDVFKDLKISIFKYAEKCDKMKNIG